jgi:hypothetical protein
MFSVAGSAEFASVGGGRKLSNHALQLCADVARVVHEKPTVLRVLGVKGQSQKASFTAESEAGAASDVQKWGAGAGSIALNDLDVPTLFDDEQPSTAVGGLLDVERCRESMATCSRSNCAAGGGDEGGGVLTLELEPPQPEIISNTGATNDP